MGDRKDKRSGDSRDNANTANRDKDNPESAPDVSDVDTSGSNEPGHDVNEQTRRDQEQHRGGRETGKDQHGVPKKGE